ncbi:MAG TPA: M28 family peptidase [Thermomicrobiaceae bacterium]|nr:M28 family peptidase [Thermomicrobiaceae bacterium]
MAQAREGTIDRLVGEVSAARLMDTTRAIAQWQRLSGTPDERHAFDYVEQTLRGTGYATRRFDPVCLVSLPGPASLTLLDDGSQPTCITHSFSTSTGPEGLTGEVVYLGAGTEANYAGQDVRGKIVLAEGLAGPNKVGPSERHGAAAMIHISGPEIHEMIISPIWGSPTPDNVDQLPTIPHVSIDAATGALLKERLDRGPLMVRLTTEVDTGWRPLPILVADLPAAAPLASDDFVLLSGHIDSWYYGAMDNGSANASMIETARILAEHRDLLRRGLRVAFWSGHSHARYGTSAWYADEHWQELNDHCVAHVNIDSPGGIGASLLTEAPTMAETYGVARELIGYLSDQELAYRRIGRMGDQSLWGIGVPSLYCSISVQGGDEGGPDLTDAIGGEKRRGGGLGWWWHTADDTLDKLDPDNLARDAGILLATVYQLVSDRVLPFDQTAAVEEIRRAVAAAERASGEAIALSGLVSEADALHASARQLTERLSQPTDDDQARALNRCLMQVSRALIPVNYTRAGRFSQDPALDQGVVPGLRDIAALGQLPAGSPERYLLETRARRERNRLRAALVEARRAIDDTLAAIS